MKSVELAGTLTEETHRHGISMKIHASKMVRFQLMLLYHLAQNTLRFLENVFITWTVSCPFIWLMYRIMQGLLLKPSNLK